MLVQLLFYAFSAVLLASAFGVIILRNPVHSALSLVVTLVAFRDAGTVIGDRIEHGAVVPPELYDDLRELAQRARHRKARKDVATRAAGRDHDGARRG